jgi:poly(ADP-ribose) glycohydrolase ARH3
MPAIDCQAIWTELQRRCASAEFHSRIALAQEIQSPADLARLGNGIEALESVVTAIASFTLTPDSYEQTIANLIFLGGDTDTLAAMAGAVSGSFLGIQGIPERLINRLEDSPQGRSYLLRLADRLADSCRAHSGR